MAQRAGSRRRMCVTTHASTTAANRRDARGRNCGSYCGAHRLPAGRTAAREESRRASCRSGRKTIRRSTTATVQGICPFRGNRRILVTAHAPSQRIFRRFFFRIRYFPVDANHSHTSSFCIRAAMIAFRECMLHLPDAGRPRTSSRMPSTSHGPVRSASRFKLLSTTRQFLLARSQTARIESALNYQQESPSWTQALVVDLVRRPVPAPRLQSHVSDPGHSFPPLTPIAGSARFFWTATCGPSVARSLFP